MRTKLVAIEAGKIMLVRTRTDRRIGVADGNEVALALDWHFVTRRGAFAVKHKPNPRNSRCRIHQRLRRDGPGGIDAHERPQRAVMFDERVCDRTDHADRTRAELLIESRL